MGASYPSIVKKDTACASLAFTSLYNLGKLIPTCSIVSNYTKL